MSKEKTMKKQIIEWRDLADIPDEDFEAGRVVLTGLADGDQPVDGFEGKRIVIAEARWEAWDWGALMAIGLGLARIVPEHPHGLIPEEPGAVIHVAGDYYTLGIDRWHEAGEDGWRTVAEMQALADAHGFEQLVPESRVETEAMSDALCQALAAIRAVRGHDGTVRRCVRAVEALLEEVER